MGCPRSRHMRRRGLLARVILERKFMRRSVMVGGFARNQQVFGLSRDTIAKMCRYSAPPCRARCLAADAAHEPGQSIVLKDRQFLSAASHCVSNRPIWLGEAAQPCDALPPTIQRIVLPHIFYALVSWWRIRFVLMTIGDIMRS